MKKPGRILRIAACRSLVGLQGAVVVSVAGPPPRMRRCASPSTALPG